MSDPQLAAFESRPTVRSVRSDTNIDQVIDLVRNSRKEELTALCPTTNASLLFYAVQRANDAEATDLCKLLCEELRVCDPKQVDRNQQTALFFAARDGNAECVRYLTSLGCSPDHRDSALQTALFYAARDGRVEAVEALLDSGADINVADHLGQTALFYGARDGRTATVALMLKRGANMNLRDRHRRTALYYAIRNSHRDMVALLKSTAGSVDASRTDTLSAAQGVGDSPSSSQPLDGATAAPVSGPAIRGPGGASNKHARVSAAATAAAWPAAADGRASNGQVQLPADLQPTRRRCYRLCIKAPGSFQVALHWLSAPLPQVKLFESLVPSVAVWPKDAPCPVSDIFADSRGCWQPLALSILDELAHSEGGWIFLKPVDCKAWRCPDYYDVIKSPMDFMTMRKKFKSQSYQRCSDFVADMELIFSNCFRYNRPESHVAALGRAIQAQYQTLLEKELKVWIQRENELEEWYSKLSAETLCGDASAKEASDAHSFETAQQIST